MDTSKSFDAPEAKLHFLDYWRIIRVRKTVILAVFLLVSITATLVTFILPPKYASTARISVSKDAPDIAGIGGGQSYNMFDPYWVQTEFEKIQSKSILYPVITNLELPVVERDQFHRNHATIELTIRDLKEGAGLDAGPERQLGHS